VLCLRSCSIVAAESDPNLGAKTHPHDEMIGPSPVKLFLREPVVLWVTSSGTYFQAIIFS
jgi:hypothetical protein